MSSVRVQLTAAWFIALVLMIPFLSGCGQYTRNPDPGDPVGVWISDRSDAAFRFDEDGTGVFTLCEPAPDYYSYSAESWPSSTSLTWTSVESGQLHEIDIRQDSEAAQSAGAGFDTINEVLVWSDGRLQMGVDVNVVIFSKAAANSFQC